MEVGDKFQFFKNGVVKPCKMEVFFLDKLPNQYCYTIKVYKKLQVHLEKTLRLKENHFHVDFAV